MGRAFFDKTAYAPIGFNPQDFETVLRNVIDSPDGILLIADEGGPIGMLGAIKYPFYMNRSHITVQELFWWVDENQRGTNAGTALISALESWAAEHGAKSVQMACLEAIEPQRIGALYRRRGYAASDHSFLKVAL